MSHPLDGPWLKVERAKFHLECLDDAASEFLATNPYRTYIEVDREQSQKLLWIEVTRDPPSSLALILGDCIHNLRSALDHFAWQCALLKGNPRRECQFPIFLNEAEYLGKPGRRRSGVSMLREVKVPEAIALIEGVQPYHKGPAFRQLTGLWIIDVLSNVDKHRLMPVVMLYSRVMGSRGNSQIGVNFGPYQGKRVLAFGALDVPDEELQVDISPGATIAIPWGNDIPPIAEGILLALEKRCIPAVEKLLRESVSLGIFPPWS